MLHYPYGPGWGLPFAHLHPRQSPKPNLPTSVPAQCPSEEHLYPSEEGLCPSGEHLGSEEDGWPAIAKPICPPP